MNILFAALDFSPFWHRGGPPRITNSYAEEFTRLGVNVSVVCSAHRTKNPFYVGDLRKEKITYLWDYDVSFLKKFYLNFSPVSFFALFFRSVRAGDWVYLTQSRSAFNLYVYILSLFMRFNIILSPFGSLPDRGKWHLKCYDILITRPLVRKAAVNLGQTSNELEVLRKFGAHEESLFLAPLCLSPKIIKNIDVESKKIRDRLNINPEQKIVLFLGRFHPSKGIDYLLESLISLLRNKKIKLVLIGVDNGMLAFISNFIEINKIEDSVLVMDPVYGDDRFYWYYLADCYVITPAIYEETPLAAIEAISVGTPVVTNFRADIPYLNEYNAGHVMQQGECLVDVLIEILSKDRLLMRRNAKKLFSDIFELSVNASDLLKFIVKKS